MSEFLEKREADLLGIKVDAQRTLDLHEVDAEDAVGISIEGKEGRQIDDAVDRVIREFDIRKEILSTLIAQFGPKCTVADLRTLRIRDAIRKGLSGLIANQTILDIDATAGTHILLEQLLDKPVRSFCKRLTEKERKILLLEMSAHQMLQELEVPDDAYDEQKAIGKKGMKNKKLKKNLSHAMSAETLLVGYITDHILEKLLKV